MSIDSELGAVREITTDAPMRVAFCIISELTRPGISIFDIDGRLLARWGNEGRTEEDPLFVTLHDITVDSEGSVYVCEVMGVIADTPFFPTRRTRMIQKFVRKK